MSADELQIKIKITKSAHPDLYQRLSAVENKFVRGEMLRHMAAAYLQMLATGMGAATAQVSTGGADRQPPSVAVARDERTDDEAEISTERLNASAAMMGMGKFFGA